MSYQVAPSPWDVVNNPPEQEQTYFGEVSLNAWFAMLVPGQGKLPYDDRTLDPKTGKQVRRYTAIDLAITPIVESGLTFEVTRTMLAEFGEWKDTVWPSLRDLGVLDAATLNGKFAKIAMISTGRKYNDKNGVEREANAIQFLALYDTHEACVNAWKAEFGGSTPAPAPAPTNGNGANTEQATALKFASAYVKNAARKSSKDLAKMREILVVELAKQPVISKYFTVDSPEIVEMMTAEVG